MPVSNGKPHLIQTVEELNHLVFLSLLSNLVKVLSIKLDSCLDFIRYRKLSVFFAQKGNINYLQVKS